MKPFPQSDRVAIVYDRLNSDGGAEVVLQSLLRMYPQATVFSSVVDRQGASWLGNFPNPVQASWLQQIPRVFRRHRLLGWLMPLVFESFDFSEFEVVISVSSEAAKAVLTRPGQLHVCYLLTPTRYLWSHAAEYELAVPGILRPLWRLVRRWLRRWDIVASTRPDYVVALSPLIAERLETFSHRIADAVVFPPVKELPSAQKPEFVPPFPYIFSWGRMVPYKRFSLLLAAAQRAGLGVIVAGDGPEKGTLQKQASLFPASSRVLDRLPAAQIRWYLEHSLGAVFPQREDFGLVTLESLLAGCPVLLNEESGSAICVRPQKDGVLFPEKAANTSDFAKILTKFAQKNWDRLDIHRQARQYSGMQFEQEWQKTMQRFWDASQRLLQ